MLLKGASYHVIASANRGEAIMPSSEFKEMFLQVMATALEKFSFSYYGFCLLDDHIHFILKPTGRANLSKIMQWILSVFAMRYNRRLALKGHVWYDRFKSRIVADFFQYLDAYIFILKRPAALGLCKNPSDYPYNDLNECFADLIAVYQPP